MSLRSLLAWIPPRLSQIGSGDTVLAYGANMTKQNNANASPIVIGSAVYSPSAGNVNLAKANAIGTSDVVGLVADVSITNATTGNIQTTGIITATTGQWDAVVTGESGGLTAGSVYYLDPSTAGFITATAPTTVGQTVVRIGVALSTTQLDLDINQPILL